MQGNSAVPEAAGSPASVQSVAGTRCSGSKKKRSTIKVRLNKARHAQLNTPVVTQWLSRVLSMENSLPHSRALLSLSFFSLFFFFFLIFIIFKTNAREGAETWFSLPFKATERHKARPVKSSSLNHAVREMGAAAPPNSSAVA